MSNFNPPTAKSACLTALRVAILAEQQVLELDIYIVSARVQELLRESLRHLEPVVLPIGTTSNNYHPPLRPVPLPLFVR